MRGALFAFLGGAFITLQGVANTTISGSIGTWQAAALTQFTGFVVALIVLLIVRDGKLGDYTKVKPGYLFGGAFAAIIIFSNVKAIQEVGVTISIAALLIAQLGITFAIDSFGWFGVQKQRMKLPQFLGIGLMIGGVIVLSV